MTASLQSGRVEVFQRVFRWGVPWTIGLLWLVLLGFPVNAQVRVWQGTLELPVYEEGAPDSNPAFDQYATDRFNFPYTLRTSITGERRVHSLRAIYLENEYLKCSVLPDVGGHVYTCIDKINGESMFYANSAIKKALIGYRGAWAAFGVEFNFPVSHNWMSMSPVDFAFGAKEDGSASVTVGNIDRVYGMEWNVELTLRPGSTVLEQHVRLSNRSDVRQRFYWWSNAGVRIWNDSRIEYPMRFTASHGFTEVSRWPVDASGKDLSVIRNQTDGPVSVFVHGSREDFMGIWHPHTNAGTAHFAHYEELPAKKIWSWGVDADGLDWRKALSDDESAYAEVQGGLFRDQETYAFLEPRKEIKFTEYWMPVRGLGGISRANLAGVVHLNRKAEKVEVSLNVNQRFDGATIRLLSGSMELLSEKSDLVPERIWTRSVTVPANGVRCTFELKDRDGVVLLKHTEGEYDWAPESEIHLGPQKNWVAPVENERTADDWVQLGTSQELNGQKLAATRTYEHGLQKFSGSYELTKAQGRVLVSLRRFEEARPLLKAAHLRNTTDGEVSYYLGIAEDVAGNERAALNSYEEASRSPAYRGAAALRLAEVKARAGKLVEARGYLAESRKAEPDDQRAAEESVAIAGALGESGGAAQQARELLSRFPSSAFLREEAGQPDLQHLAADSNRVIGVAAEYARLGMYRKSVTVLERDYPEVPAEQREPGSEVPQRNPMVVYLCGYFREKLGESGVQDFAQAAQLSTLYVFPSTVDERLALEAALRSNSRDANAHYLLGTWFFGRGMTDVALREWSAAREVNAKVPALDASLGLALLHEKRDFAGALDVFEEGIQNDSANLVNYSGGVAALSLLPKPARARVELLERYPDLLKMPTELVYELALNRAEAGDFDGAKGLFQKRFFGREEGGTNVRQVWVEVNLLEALSLAKSGKCKQAVAVADKLGASVDGLEFTRDGLERWVEAPRTQHLLGETYSKCARTDLAENKFSQAAQATAVPDLTWAQSAAEKLGRNDTSGWMERFKNAMAEQHCGATASSGWSKYVCGVFLVATGEKDKGREQLRQVFLSRNERLSWHLARLVLEREQ